MTISATMAMGLIQGNLAARVAFERTPVVLVLNNPIIENHLKDRNLCTILHTQGIWYFADKDTKWPRPRIYAIPDAVVTSVATPASP